MNNNDIANANAGAAATFSTTPTKQQQQQQQQEEHRSNSTFLQDYDSDNDDNGNDNDDGNGNGNDNGNGNGNTNDNDDELSQTTNGTRQSQAQQDYATNGIGGGGIAIPPKNVTVNDSLSKELLKLSLYDRNAMEEEIHGVRCLSSYEIETPTLLKEKLIEFDIELQKVILIRKKKRKKTLQQQKQSKVGTPNIKTKMKANNDNNEETTEDTDSDTDVLRNIIPMQSQSQQSHSSSSSTQDTNTNDDDDEKQQDNESDENEKKELCYVNDPDVRLRFLRCDSFDSKKAVKRFVSFLEFSTAIFGNFIADRPPKITDVYNNNNNNNSNREEIRALQNSRAQYLPFRDRSGRRIHCLVGKVGFDLEFILRCKIVMYLHWIASEDIETQQKGIVVIAWPSDEDNYTSLWEKGNLRLKIKKQNTETFKQNFNVALPVRVTSIHFCSKNQPIYKVLSSLFYFSLNTHHKSRYKTHFGDTMEILYKLQSYGIPVDLLPMTYSGTVKTTAHSQWVTFRTTVEQQQEEKQKQRIRKQQQRRARNQHDEKQPQFISSSCNADVIDNGNDDGNANANQTAAANTRNDEDDEIILVECPRSYDICFRKGKSFKNNPGNLQFRSLIEETHHSHFMLSDRKDKFDMTLKIADQIMNNNTSSAPRSNGSSNGSSGGAGAGGGGGGGGGGQQMRILEWSKKRNAWLLVNDIFAIRQKVANSYKEYKRSCIGRQNALSTSMSMLNRNAKNANANNANASNNNANNAKSFPLVEAVNTMTNTNTATTNNNNNDNSTETSGGRKNQRQFQQQQQHHQQQIEEQQRDEYMFLQSKRQKITTTIPTATTPTPTPTPTKTTTASSSFLGEVGATTNNCTGCFSFHQHQNDGGSGSGSDSGNEDSNNYGNNCNNSNTAYNWLL